MIPIARSRVATISRAAVPVAFVGAVAAVLLLFPPGQYSFYPQCPIFRYLHLQCPGCGTTRAIAALLHGHLMEALRLNALTTLLITPAAIYAILCYRHFLQRKPFHWPQLPSAVICSAFAIAVIFTILRNQ